jgi:transglutaminase/protease-like cytokinesis protein 3
MKVNQYFLIFVVSFVVNGSLIAKSHAYDFDSGKARIAKAISDAKIALDKEIERKAEAKREADKRDEQQKRIEEQARNPKVSNSQYLSEQVFPIDTHWALIKISKDQYQEDVVLSVINGHLIRPLVLRRGAGNYQLKIYSTNNPKKYESRYSYVNQLNLLNLDTRDLSFLLPSEEVESDDPGIINIANKLVAGLDNDADKIKKIHDYVAFTVSYNFEGYRTGSYVNEATDAVSVLKNPITVCAGYANLFAAIARAAHIRTSIVYGKAKIESGEGDHAWNEVLIDNEWRIVDVTWDDMETLRYDYFFPTLEFFSKDHQKVEVKDDL